MNEIIGNLAVFAGGSLCGYVLCGGIKNSVIRSYRNVVDIRIKEAGEMYAIIDKLRRDLRISKAMGDGYHDKMLELKEAAERRCLEPSLKEQKEVNTSEDIVRDPTGHLFATLDDDEPLVYSPGKVEKGILATDWTDIQAFKSKWSDHVQLFPLDAAPAEPSIFDNKCVRRDDVKFSAVGMPVACDVPPIGWFCTRTGGHEGPCAAHPYITGESTGDFSAGSNETPGKGTNSLGPQ